MTPPKHKKRERLLPVRCSAWLGIIELANAFINLIQHLVKSFFVGLPGSDRGAGPCKSRCKILLAICATLIHCLSQPNLALGADKAHNSPTLSVQNRETLLEEFGLLKIIHFEFGIQIRKAIMECVPSGNALVEIGLEPRHAKSNEDAKDGDGGFFHYFNIFLFGILAGYALGIIGRMMPNDRGHLPPPDHDRRNATEP